MRKRHHHRSSSFVDLLEEFFNTEDLGVRSWGRFPAANIKENENDFTIELIAPGRSKEDIKIHQEKDALVVASELKAEYDGEGYRRREFQLSPFKRSFRLPGSADQDKINAAFANGILTITIGKKEEAKVQREIEIS